jgi:bifunctional UDP-N-acetylglucosamine pyrophosphorylase/glucosamine-1-phosphate N-acetyltransferase/UDP-N-acetylglucosamine pyrophosphorylase
MSSKVSTATAIVMAAGKGVRMKSELPKVLVPVCGRPMIDYVLDALARAGVDRIIVVVGYRADDVRQALAGRVNVEFALQAEQRGTGHAVMCAREHLPRGQGPVLVVAGDSPMMQHDSIRTLLDEFERTHPACLLGTGTKDDPAGLGRVVRDGSGKFAGIVEEKDATAEQKQIREVNLSCYVFNGPDLLDALDRIRPDNAQGEYYITDCPGVLLAAGRDVRALNVLKPCEALSINNRDELAVVEAAMRELGIGCASE